ncbi:hypothetical protein PVAP13_1NG492319 [Panicum virgatum]|uniref:Uncharacterized protein n=1 Tax=Panicum virgatum TaxID=38727 RepID=A0A8T0XFL9_PANVG|nr:hypothetical protein PVAP13_1NG492319 [Panicum virgatum]
MVGEWSKLDCPVVAVVTGDELVSRIFEVRGASPADGRTAVASSRPLGRVSHAALFKALAVGFRLIHGRRAAATSPAPMHRRAIRQQCHPTAASDPRGAPGGFPDSATPPAPAWAGRHAAHARSPAPFASRRAGRGHPGDLLARLPLHGTEPRASRPAPSPALVLSRRRCRRCPPGPGASRCDGGAFLEWCVRTRLGAVGYGRRGRLGRSRALEANGGSCRPVPFAVATMAWQRAGRKALETGIATRPAQFLASFRLLVADGRCACRAFSTGELLQGAEARRLALVVAGCDASALSVSMSLCSVCANACSFQRRGARNGGYGWMGRLPLFLFSSLADLQLHAAA